MSKICNECQTLNLDIDNKCFMCGGSLHTASQEEIDNALEAHAQEVMNDKIEEYSKSEQYTPKCPLCQSPNIKQISIAKRAVHGYAFGLFSNTARSQWECLNCGNKF